jgi:hypothetical protein
MVSPCPYVPMKDYWTVFMTLHMDIVPPEASSVKQYDDLAKFRSGSNSSAT